jgi:hypothetical protein
MVGPSRSVFEVPLTVDDRPAALTRSYAQLRQVCK